MRKDVLAIWVGAIALIISSLTGEQSWGQSEVLQVSTAWSQSAARPGDTVGLAVVIDIQSGWHINADADQVGVYEGFVPVPTELVASASDSSLTFGAVRYPVSHELMVSFASQPVKVFEGRAIFNVPVTVADGATPGERDIELTLNYQACDDKQCLFPTSITLKTSLSVVSKDTAVTPTNPELFTGFNATAKAESVSFHVFGWNFAVNAATTGGLVLLLALAILGGFLLNFTPCVLPVIPIKIIGLSQAAGSRGRCFVLGLTMSCGVVLFWVVLGAIIATATEFTAANQLFQYPAFTITVGILIAVMALGMFGAFAVRLPRLVYLIDPRHDTILGSVGFGVMTAVLSTPCTAPFMGTAAGWAALQPPLITMAMFCAIGAGMALPYLVLAANPRLVEKMPRTGPGSELLKQVMGLLMLAAAAYFVGVGIVTVFTPADEAPSKLYWWAVALCGVAAGGWLVWRVLRISRRIGPRITFITVGVVAMVVSGTLGFYLTRPEPIDWIQYTPERFAEELKKGRVVLMDFTAEWCLNCKALEHAVLYDERVLQTVKQPQVVALKVDITSRKNLAGQEMLKQVGSVTIPLLVVFAPDGSQVFKSEAYTVNEVVAAIEAAKRGRLVH